MHLNKDDKSRSSTTLEKELCWEEKEGLAAAVFAIQQAFVGLLGVLDGGD